MRSRLLIIFLLLFAFSLETQAQKVQKQTKSKTLVGIVTDYRMGASWDGIVFRAGKVYYFVQLSSKDGDVTKYATVPQVGDKVSVTYKRITNEKWHGAIVVDAVRVTVLSK